MLFFETQCSNDSGSNVAVLRCGHEKGGKTALSILLFTSVKY